MSLKITARSAKPFEQSADVTVVGVYAAGGKKGASAIDALDKRIPGLKKLAEREDFTGKREQALEVITLGKDGKLVILGLGPKDSVGAGEVRAFAAKAARCANAQKVKSLALCVPEGVEGKLRAIAEGLELGAYRFVRYFTGERKPKSSLESVAIGTERKVPGDAKKQIEAGQRIAAAVNVSRDLSNEPPNVMFPAAMAEAAQKHGKENKLKVTVYDDKEIVKRGMLLIHAVGRGSRHGPRLVHLQYSPGKKATKRLVFVGKGITFDTGGISIKPAAGMETMKHDMSGAANVLGLMIAVARLKPKNVEVHGLMSCAENMPGGDAYRPSDVWGSLDGKFVEIINTDAEGRLVLADALAYGAKLEPDLMVDNATLTGACVVALGTTCSAFYASNEDTAQRFGAAVKTSGEQMWRMPLLEDLRDQLKSDVADIKHTGDRWGGSITAALFLREFIGDTKNWVHVDLAGPAAADRPYSWHPKGATGHGVLTFLSIVERFAQSK